MSYLPPKRSLPASSEKPSADFNWPPTDDELAQYGIEFVQSASEKPPADFNWPPTDDELAQYSIETVQSEAVFDRTGVKTAEPPVAPASLEPHATSVVPPETPAQLPAPVIAQETSPMPADPVRATARDREPAMFNRHEEEPPPASSEPRYAAFNCPPVDEGPTRSDPEDPKRSGIEDSTTSGIAVAQSETALDETGAGEWAAEIARLQALIEGLTQKVEWRITNVTGR